MPSAATGRRPGGSAWLGGVRRAFKALALHPDDGAIIQLSGLGRDAALYGAAVLAAQAE